MLALRAGAQRHALPLGANDTPGKTNRWPPALAPPARRRGLPPTTVDMALDADDGAQVATLVRKRWSLPSPPCALSSTANRWRRWLTELLAEQHANNFRNWSEPLGIEVGWLAGKQKGKARQGGQQGSYRQRRGADDCRHPAAIFQEQVQFNGLALVITTNSTASACISGWRCGRKVSSRIPPASADHDRHADPAPRAMTAYADLDLDYRRAAARPNSGDHRRHPDTRRSDIIESRAQRLYP